MQTYITYRIFQMKREELETGVFITERDGPRSVYRIRFNEMHGVKRGFVLQFASACVFTLAVLVYLPLLYTAPLDERLSTADVRVCVCLSLASGGSLGTN